MAIALDHTKTMTWSILIDHARLWGERMKEDRMTHLREKLTFYIYIFLGNNKKSNKIIIVVYQQIKILRKTLYMEVTMVTATIWKSSEFSSCISVLLSFWSIFKYRRIANFITMKQATNERSKITIIGIWINVESQWAK